MSLSLVSRGCTRLRLEIARRFQQRAPRTASAALLCAVALTAGAQTVQHFPGTTSLQTPSTQAVTVTVQGTVDSIRVLTQGIPQLDFTDAGGGSCAPGTYIVPTACTVNVTVKPTVPGRRTGAVVLVDSTNHVLGQKLIDAQATGALSVIRPGVMTTVAGISSDWRYRAGDEGRPASSATIYLPQGVVADDSGRFYVADTVNNRIRRVDSQGLITTYAGIGYNSAAGDGGPATSAGVSNPTGLALDGAGNLYIADSGNNAIRRIDVVTGVMTTVAGQLANSGYSGDAGQATAATLTNPNGIVIDADGNLFIADTGNNAVRRVDAITKEITTIAGGASATGNDGGLAVAASLNQPWSLTIGPTGLLYIADLSNNAIRQIDAGGIIHTVAGRKGQDGYGGDGGLATSALLRGPSAVALDAIGNIYIADTANNRVRRVDALTGKIDTISGSQDTSYGAVSGQYNADEAALYGPYALSLDGHANLYLADYFHNVIRLISSSQQYRKYPTIRVSKTSDPKLATIENDGNATLTPGTPEFDQSALDPVTTTCGSSVPTVGAGGTCVLGVQFAPTQVGTVIMGTLKFHSDGANDPDLVNLSGEVLTVEPTQTMLTSSLNPAGVTQSVTFTAVVSETGAGSTSVPTGTVTFLDGTTALGAPVTLNPNGIATFSTSTLSLGQHDITAKYAGDASNASNTSAILSQSILQTTQLIVQSSLQPSSVLQNVTFTATLTSSSPVATGTVITFFDGTVSIGTGALDGAGKATFSTSSLAAGSHQISAKFAGNSTSLTSTSPELQQTVNRVASSTMLAANPSTVAVGSSVTLTATVTSAGGPLPTGSVAFKSGNTALGNGTLDSNGVASLTTTALAPGQNAVTAVYAGDLSNLTSTSAAFTVTVTRLITVTTLASGTNPANAGSTLQLTANVSLGQGQTALGTISGTITFYDGATSIGAGSVSNGVATLSTNALRVGTHPLTAVYSGNTNYDTSTSAAVSQVIQSSATTTQLVLSAASVVAGKPLTLTATVNNGGVKATGTITFTDGGTTIGTARLNAQAVGSLTLTTLPVGSHSIVATYGGDLNYETSASAAAPVTVTIGNTVLTLAATPARATYGANITVATNLATDGVLPSNPSVTVQDNGSTLQTLTLNAQGAASFLTSTLAVGTHNLIASYVGDGNNAAAQSQTITVTIDAATTTTALTSSNTTAVFGNAVTLQAKVSSGGANLTGTVTFQDGSTSLGTAPLNASGIATISNSNFTVGQHSIVAIYSGDATHSTSTSAVLAQIVVAPTTVALRSSVNPSVGGNAVLFTAQITGSAANSGVTAAPTGNVVFRDGANIIGTGTVDGNGIATLNTSSLAVGTHPIMATYSGDSLYAGNNSANLNQVVQNASSQTVLSTSSNPAAYAAPLTLTARVTGNGSTPTGNVTFLDGSAPIGQAATNGGIAVLTLSTLSPGMHTITAAYVGDPNNGPSTSPVLNQQVQQIAQIALASSSNPALTLQTPSLTATVRNTTGGAATGTVRFLDGTSLLGTAQLTGGVATLVAGPFSAGSHTLTATYGGDVANLQAASSPLALQVNLRPTQSALTATAPTSAGILSLISVVKWDGPAVPTGITTFRTPNSVIGTSRVDGNGVATLNVQATTINGKVTANYSGDVSYSASSSPATDIGTVAATNFTLSISKPTISMPTKQYVVEELTVKSLNGFTDTIALGCLGLPYAATCTFDHDSVKLTADGSFTVKVTIDTGSPLTSGGESSGRAQVMTPTSTTLALLPAGALLGWLLFGKKRRAVPTLLLLMLASLLLPTVGCGTIDIKSTPPGSYTIAVSAVGQSSGVTLSQQVAMTVTQ